MPMENSPAGIQTMPSGAGWGTCAAVVGPAADTMVDWAWVSARLAALARTDDSGVDVAVTEVARSVAAGPLASCQGLGSGSRWQAVTNVRRNHLRKGTATSRP